jgi:hypothetical protein
VSQKKKRVRPPLFDSEWESFVFFCHLMLALERAAAKEREDGTLQ